MNNNPYLQEPKRAPNFNTSFKIGEMEMWWNPVWVRWWNARDNLRNEQNNLQRINRGEVR